MEKGRLTVPVYEYRCKACGARFEWRASLKAYEPEALSGTTDTLSAARGFNELRFIDEVISRLSDRVVISPWMRGEIKGLGPLRYLLNSNGQDKATGC